MAQVGRGRAPQLGENQRDVGMRELIGERERERERDRERIIIILYQSFKILELSGCLYLLLMLLHIPQCVLISVH